MSDAAMPMPQYKCHKTVYALKIKDVSNSDENFNVELTFEDERYAPMKVGLGWYHDHKVVPGGYYVVYEDGYKSFSPADAFERGYSRISP